MSDADRDPSPLYGAGARALQDEFGTRRLADRLQGWTVHYELTDDDVALIGAQSTVWIATVDADGWPDVSYKGGDAGFVDVVTSTELRIPSYDGNGMMRTMGNIADTGRVGLLFVDTSRPWRMRLHGEARIETGDAYTSRHHGALAVIVVTLGRIFPNCGRYIHRARPDLRVRTASGSASHRSRTGSAMRVSGTCCQRPIAGASTPKVSDAWRRRTTLASTSSS